MIPRERLTRTAAPRPATPDEGPAWPNISPDPGPDEYQTGDTSSWAEDVVPPPYPNGLRPATPDEGPAWTGVKDASDQRDLRKAEMCIKLATSMLGEPNTAAAVNAVERQAALFMNMSDDAVLASVRHLAEEEDEEDEEEVEVEVEVEEESKKASLSHRVSVLERVFVRLAEAEEEEEEESEESSKTASVLSRVARIERVLIKAAEEEEVEEESSKKASSGRIAILERKLARIERVLLRLAEEEEDEDEDESSKKACGEEYMGSEESMYESMLAEEGMYEVVSGDDDGLETLYESMLAEEGMHHKMSDEFEEDGFEEMVEEMVEETVEESMDEVDYDEFVAEDDMNIFDTDFDPLADVTLEESDRLLFAALTADDKTDGKEEEEAAKKASARRTASAVASPRPRTQPTGATSISPTSKKASGKADDNLEGLWQSAPNVDRFYK